MLALAGFVGLCLLVGATGGALTAGSVHAWFGSLKRPPGMPPDWVFGLLWNGITVLIGVSAWMVWHRRGPAQELRLWGWQLAVNALWAPAFFGLRSPAFGLAVIVVLIPLTAVTLDRFRRVRPAAAWLMLPYLGWCCYACYLNAGFWWLNPA